MRSDVAIALGNISKTYRIFSHPGDRIKQALTLGRLRFHREFTALKDVSFEIKKGEAVGIIGRNGSGKSTLLQLICGILKPTSGLVETHGRISAILELGSGFNPEFTGRENVYFQGAIMGLTTAQMDSRFEGIAAFAEIGEFIDQPVRIYSSGMFVRLAFAVAVSVEPDILVVDEALAVGDEGFRSRCYRRIGELRNAGCTILFVSHSMDQIAKLCSRVALFDDGELLLDGAAGKVIAQYQRLSNASPGQRKALREQIKTGLVASPDDAESDAGKFADTAVAYAPNGALIDAVRMLDAAGQEVRLLQSGADYRCLYRVSFTQDVQLVRGAMLIRTLDGLDLSGALTAPTMDAGIATVAQGSSAEISFEFSCRLNPGIYQLNVAVFGCEARVEYALHGIQGALRFEVVADASHAGLGVVNLAARAAVRLSGPAGA